MGSRAWGRFVAVGLGLKSGPCVIVHSAWGRSGFFEVVVGCGLASGVVVVMLRLGVGGV